jgi:hypothetical protein
MKAIQSHPKLPAKKITSLDPAKKPSINWQIHQNHPLKPPSKNCIFAACMAFNQTYISIVLLLFPLLGERVRVRAGCILAQHQKLKTQHL